MRFFDRKYLLQIGDPESGNALSINDLQITFKVRKSVNNKEKVDKCSISIYNLSEESLTLLEESYTTAVFSCGYESQDNVVRLFFGEITEVDTKKSGTDRVTSLNITPSFSELTFQIMSALIPENGTVEDVIEVIRKETSLVKGTYKGSALTRPIIYGYPLSGTPKEMMDRVCDEYNLQWRIEGEALYINDALSVESEIKETAPVISPTTGLIDKPYPFTGSDRKSKNDDTKKSGIRFKALINPKVVPGTIVRVDYSGESNFYRVEEVDFAGDFRGDNWYMDCICSKRPE